MKSLFPQTFYLLSLLCYISEGSISKNLKYYEVLHADSLQHRIVKRGIQESAHPLNKIKEISFETLGKQFRLILSPQHNVLDSMFKAYAIDGDGNETPIHFDRENFYEGRVFGESASKANLHIDDDGLATGTIHLKEETYHIEPSWRHLPDLKDNRTMITYKGSDVKLSWDDPHFQNGIGLKTCGYVKEENELEDEQENGEKNYEAEENVWKTNFHREKRQIITADYKPTKTRCSLLLVADYRFYKEMGGSNTKTTINYLISLIDRVHKIYNDTIWDSPQKSDGFTGMGFIIKKIVVHNEPTRLKFGETLHYNMARKIWDVRNLLEVFSRSQTNKGFCLAHLFTHQTFNAKDSVVLGLAYIASPRNLSPGGICSKEYSRNGYTLYLNTGLSSSRNHYGYRVITREADLVTAHELGHNWGSEHDPDIPECSPKSSLGGSFLMYTYSVGGLDENNKKFSPCSLRAIRKVLLAKSHQCFSEPEDSFCGNLRVEGDEECDAGLLGTEDNDSCCDKDCKLRKFEGAQCSDKNSPCCQNCRFISRGIECRKAQYATCELESTCSGTHAECPDSPPVQDGTECQERGKCKSGKCIPFCETRGMQSCMCEEIKDACKRCCRTGRNRTCYPVKLDDILPDGTPCIKGFCNQGICEKTIQDVVERFWNIIEDISINKVLLFFKDNIVGSVILITAVIWIPASFVIGRVDRKRQREEDKRRNWQNRTSELVYPLDHRRVVRVKVPQHNSSLSED